MGTIRFELRKEKIDKDGLAPIRIIYQIGGQRKFFPTDIKTYPANWDSKTQLVCYVKKGLLLDLEVKALNKRLSDKKREIEKIEDKLQANGIIFSPEMIQKEREVIAKPVEKRDASSSEVYNFIDQYILANSQLRIKGSLSVYKSLKTHLMGHEKKTGQKVTFEKIDYPFFQSFHNYLLSLTKEVEGKKVKALNNITIAKQLSTLKTFLNYAKKQDIEVSNKYQTFKIERKNDLEVIALTAPEFQKLWNMDLSKKPAMDQVRDVFMFSCVTGLRYSDLKQLRREHIKDGYITLTIVKTDRKRQIPLNPYSTAILKKYASSSRPLPVISNQKSNEHLNNICDWAGINEPVEIVRKYGSQRVVNVYPKYELIRMHCGRKTFATLSLEAGMAAELVMEIGGWEDYKSFKRYMNITKERAMKAMAQAWTISPKLKAV